MNLEAMAELFILSTGELSFFHSWSSLSLSWFSSSNWDNSWDKSSEGSDNWGVVDDVVGGVGLHMLLDCHLWDMLDSVVDLVANMMSNWDGVGSNSRGSNSLDNWGGLDSGSWDDSLDSSNSWGSNSMVYNWGSHSMDNWDSLANRINKSILIQVLRESLQSQ